MYVPIGVFIILLACFGVNSIIGLSSIQFPASVACLVLLFFGLLLCDWIMGDRRTRLLVNLIDIPVGELGFCLEVSSSNIFKAGWALRYISLFFTPS